MLMSLASYISDEGDFEYASAERLAANSLTSRAMSRFYEPNLGANPDSPFARDASGKLIRRLLVGYA
jgi:hypothetical protein